MSHLKNLRKSFATARTSSSQVRSFLNEFCSNHILLIVFLLLGEVTNFKSWLRFLKNLDNISSSMLFFLARQQDLLGEAEHLKSCLRFDISCRPFWLGSFPDLCYFSFLFNSFVYFSSFHHHIYLFHAGFSVVRGIRFSLILEGLIKSFSS